MEENLQMKRILSGMGVFFYLLVPFVVLFCTPQLDMLGWTYFLLLITVPLIPSYLYLEYDWYPKPEFMCRVMMIMILATIKYWWIGQ